MKATFLSKEKNDVKFSIEFSAEEFEQATIKSYQENKGQFAIDGFRKGKAPRKLIETHYGTDVFFEDAINGLFSENYYAAMEELKISPIDRPNAEFSEVEKGKGFTVTITVTAYPEIEVKDYLGVEIEKIEHTVSDEDVEKEMGNLQKRNSRMVVADRAAADGDMVLVDYAGFVGDNQFEGGTAESYPLKLGSGSFIPGFEEQLVGVAAGEEKDVVVTFPEQYHSEELAGKEAIFKCKVLEVKSEELPELNDDFAKDVSEHDTLEALKKETKERLEKAAAAKSLNDMKNAVLEKVYYANDVEVPNIMIEEELDNMLKEFEQQLKYQGMSIDQYFEFLNKTEQDFREEVKPEAAKKVKTRMIVAAVADAEKLQATDEELNKELELMAMQYKLDIDKIREMMGVENFVALEKDIRIRKAVDFMFEKAAIK